MPFKPEKGIAQGYGDASRNAAGVLDPRLSSALAEFHQFKSEEARAGFAFRWVRLASQKLNETWPVFYELLRIIRDKELFRQPEYIFTPGEKDQPVYESFQAFFEDQCKQPFARWRELEVTYQFVTENAPGLMNWTLNEVEAVQKMAEEAEREQAEGKGLKGQGGRGKKVIDNLFSSRQRGTSNAYRLRRIARDHPEILARMKAGEFKSVRQAAEAAGFLKPTATLPLEPDAAARALVKHFDADELAGIFAEVERLLAEEKRKAA